MPMRETIKNKKKNPHHLTDETNLIRKQIEKMQKPDKLTSQ